MNLFDKNLISLEVNIGKPRLYVKEILLQSLWCGADVFVGLELSLLLIEILHFHRGGRFMYFRKETVITRDRKPSAQSSLLTIRNQQILFSYVLRRDSFNTNCFLPVFGPFVNFQNLSVLHAGHNWNLEQSTQYLRRPEIAS